MLGGNGAFKELLEACHQRNIKVVLDGVFNHSSRGFFFFHDVLENGPYSPWVEWFKIEGWPLSPYNGEFPANYAGWDGNRALPCLTMTILKCGNTSWRLPNIGLNSALTAGV